MSERKCFVLNRVAFLFVKDVLDLWYVGYFFVLFFENVKKMKWLNEEKVKQLLIDSLVSNDTIKTEELNERAEKVDKPEDAANIIK